MQKHELDCPNCFSSIVKSYTDGVKLRCKLVKWDQNGMFAVCKSCGSDVPIESDFIKSVQSSFVYLIDDKNNLAKA